MRAVRHVPNNDDVYGKGDDGDDDDGDDDDDDCDHGKGDNDGDDDDYFFGEEQRDIGEGPASLMAHRDIEEEP